MRTLRAVNLPQVAVVMQPLLVRRSVLCSLFQAWLAGTAHPCMCLRIVRHRSPYGPRLKLSRVAIVVPELFIREGPQVCAVFPVTGIVHMLLTCNSAFCMQRLCGCSPYGPRLKLSRVAIVVPKLLIREGPQVCAVFSVVGMVHVLSMYNPDLCMQMLCGCLPYGPRLELTRVAVVVPELLIREGPQVCAVFPVTGIVHMLLTCNSDFCMQRLCGCSPYGPRLKLSRVAIVVPKLLIREGPQVCAVFSVVGMVHVLSMYNPDLCMQMLCGCLPYGPRLELTRVAVVVPELLIREGPQIGAVFPVVGMVKALRVSCAHHGHPGGLENLWLLNELILPDVLHPALRLRSQASGQHDEAQHPACWVLSGIKSAAHLACPSWPPWGP